MAKNLVIVESPAKAKTINKYLGKNYVVESTLGHIRNLPKGNLGVDIENDFTPKFVTIRGKGDVIKKLKSLAAKSKKIYIATDPDREGEAIAQDIADIFNGKSNGMLYRVLFNEITKKGVKEGMDNPRLIDSSLVSSQRARRIMDRLIGYKVSPFLWKAMIEESGNTLSAGRVQSVALRLVCDRENEIRRFNATEYWSLWGIFETYKKEKFKGKLFSINGKEIKVPNKSFLSESERKHFEEKFIQINNEKEAERIFELIDAKNHFHISNIVKKHSHRYAPAPFITSTLQSEASKAFRFRPRQTMQIAQKLYEGVDLGKEGTVGLITYMRTDSTRLSNEIVQEAREFIKDKYGNQFVPESPNVFNKKKTNVQDAHEAIRPTSLKYTPEFVRPFLDNQSFKLYDLIWKRFISCQMAPAYIETTVIEIAADEFLFKSYGQTILFNGYMQLYVEEAELIEPKDDKSEATNEKIPAGLEKNQQLSLHNLTKTQHFTKPPARYTESTLIKELESRGIGRPSTYSSIVSTIVDRKYVKIEERKLSPTHLGERVNTILIDNFPNIFEVGFTARMEEELDQIAQGENGYVNVLNDFYNPFSNTLSKVEDKIEKIPCDKCEDGTLEIKFGRFGKYLGCSNYPQCDNIKSLKDISNEKKEIEYTGETCEKCGSRTVYRYGKFGKFIGCERYPDCDYIKNVTLGIACPKCKEGELVERISKRNKKFYGCSRFPDCDFVSFNKPVNKACEQCGNYYVEEKFTKKKGNYLKCPKCNHEEIIPNEVMSEDLADE